MRTILALFLVIISSSNTFSQSPSWIKFHSTIPSRCHHGKQTKDKGFVLTGYTDAYKGLIVKTDIFGDKQWERSYYGGNFRAEFRAIIETQDGGFVAVGTLDTSSTTNTSSLYILKTDRVGNTLWEKKFGALASGSSFWDVIETSDGGIATVGASGFFPNINLDIVLTKLDSLGNTLWTNQIDSGGIEGATSLQETLDGGLIVIGDKAYTGPLLIKTNALGNVIWSTYITSPANYQVGLNSIRQLADSSYIVGGIHKIPVSSIHKKAVYLAKLSKNGQVIWENNIVGNNIDYDVFSMELAKDGGMLVAGSRYTANFDADGFLIKTDSVGNLLWRKIYNISDHSYISQIEELNNGKFALYGSVVHPGYSGNSQVFLANADESGCIFSNQLVGNIYHDRNLDCIPDSSDTPLTEVSVKIQGAGRTVYTRTDTSGNFEAHLDTGLYTLEVLPPNNSPYWITCLPNNTFHLDTLSNSDTTALAYQATIDCPFMSVDISAPFIRRGVAGSRYSVQYCNLGTTEAPNTIIEVELDPYLILTYSSIPITSQQGNFYTFNVGTVNLNDCRSFTLNILADTSAILGQTHCTNVRIFPDTLCISNSWNGPVLEVDVDCQNDTVFFEITNTGTGMLNSQQYAIYQDSTLMFIDSMQLGVNQSIIIPQYASLGYTYTIRVLQTNGFPSILGDSIVTIAVEGCTRLSSGLFSTGFLTQFTLGSTSPFSGSDCQSNIGSYDPNDKSAQPKGYDETYRYISKNTKIDYKVRFQNTGTDTAFNIVILDTLSNHLNVASIHVSSASHPYTWNIENGNILKVSFNNIMLPDSNVNEFLSHGFFKYRISQKANNPIGTILYNSASIYFDNNLPIKTNETWHTIGEDFIHVNLALSVDKVYSSDLKVTAYPNPFQEEVSIQVLGLEKSNFKILLYDNLGHLVKSKNFKNTPITINRKKLNSGIYFYRLETGDELISTGKLIVRD